MKIYSYNEMVKAYAVRPLEIEDIKEREENLSRLCYSVIVLGCYLELENADKWITTTLGIGTITAIFYGKIDYDFGFMEYFFENEESSALFKAKVPNIYTIYPNGSCSKSDGPGKDIPFIER